MSYQQICEHNSGIKLIVISITILWMLSRVIVIYRHVQQIFSYIRIIPDFLGEESQDRYDKLISESPSIE